MGQIMGSKSTFSMESYRTKRKFDDIMKSNFKKSYMDWKEKNGN